MWLLISKRTLSYVYIVLQSASALHSWELRPDDPLEIAFEISALSHGLIVLYRGGRIGVSKKKFRMLYRRSFRRYLDGLRP